MDPCSYSWITTPRIMIKNQTFLIQTLTKTWDVFMDIKIMLHKMNWLLGFENVVGKMFFLDLHEQKKTSSPRTIICNTCEKMNVSGDILNAGGNVEVLEDYGFKGSFFKTPPSL